MKIIIPSRGRGAVSAKTQKMFPSSIISVAESELQEYSKYSDTVETRPDEVRGMGNIRQWILDHYEGTVVMVDDDISYLGCFTDITYRRIAGGDNYVRILENCEQMAEDLGINLFGFNQSCDVRKYQYYRPFLFTSYAGGVMGIRNRDIKFDRNLMVRAEDVDFALQNLIKYRMILIDNRYGFVANRLSMTGGNTEYRTDERDLYEMDYLKKKWGQYIQFSTGKGTRHTSINVKRNFYNVKGL